MNDSISDFRFAICDLRGAHQGASGSLLPTFLHACRGLAFRPENGDRTPHGRRSRPKSSRLRGVKPRPCSSTIFAPTKPADRSEAAPDADSDAQDFRGISGRLNGRLPERRREGAGKAAKTQACLGRSRLPIQLSIGSLWKGRWIATIRVLSIVQQRAQCGARPGIADDPFPSGVAVQFGEKSWQFGNQFLTLCRRELLDSCFDLLDRAHGFKLRYCQNASNSRFFFVRQRSSRFADNGQCVLPRPGMLP